MKNKNFQKTSIEIINHLIESHKELVPLVEKLIFKKTNKNIFDTNLLLSLNSELLKKSTAQIRQDLFVFHHFNFKRDGFFVEFGATDGVELSNTYMLETEYGWRGILAEPAIIWHQDLIENRKAAIDKRCVWRNSDETIYFNETKNPVLSSIDIMSDNDLHASARKDGNRYSVKTVSLLDLLTEHNAPNEIDYMSIDTEGSEYDILESFDFKKYQIKVITCEHNYTPTREKIALLLINNGYERKFPHLSQFDDWWVLK